MRLLYLGLKLNMPDNLGTKLLVLIKKYATAKTTPEAPDSEMSPLAAFFFLLDLQSQERHS